MTDTLLSWLLNTDPALRWQVEKSVTHAPEEVWRATRERTATEGLGARLLALQDEDGQWAGGAYFPNRTDERVANPDEKDGQPWTATTWSLNALRDWGVPADALGDTAQRLAANSRWEYDDLPYWGGEVDCCINAFTLASGTWLGADVSGLEGWFVEHQMAEGGWNCEWENGSTRASFHSTINALEGILYREERVGVSAELTQARLRAQEYLLSRRLMHRESTGEIVGPWVTNLAYPFRFVYSALRAADYFRAASLHDGVRADPRIGDAIQFIRSARGADGTWTQERCYPGQVWFPLDVEPGQPSPWLTMYALQTLAWWDAQE